MTTCSSSLDLPWMKERTRWLSPKSWTLISSAIARPLTGMEVGDVPLSFRTLYDFRRGAMSVGATRIGDSFPFRARGRSGQSRPARLGSEPQAPEEGERGRE